MYGGDAPKQASVSQRIHGQWKRLSGCSWLHNYSVIFAFSRQCGVHVQAKAGLGTLVPVNMRLRLPQAIRENGGRSPVSSHRARLNLVASLPTILLLGKGNLVKLMCSRLFES